MDLNHAVPFSTPCRVWAGGYEDCAGAAVVVLTAGAGQKPGETRLDLAARNGAIFADVVPRITAVDPRRHPARGHEPGRRADVRRRGSCRACRRTASSAPAPSSTPRGSGISSAGTSAWTRGASTRTSSASTGTAKCPCGRWPTSPACGCRTSARRTISGRTRRRWTASWTTRGAPRITSSSGRVRRTSRWRRDCCASSRRSFAIRPRCSRCPASSRHDYGMDDVCLSLPTVVTRNGIERVLHLPLNDGEAEAFRRSGDVVRESDRAD